MIEEAECVLRDLGFYDVRVRHHELKGQPSALTGQSQSPDAARHLARIELGSAEIPKLLADAAFTQVAESFKRIGYAHVTLDLAGYRRGSMNEIAFTNRTALA